MLSLRKHTVSPTEQVLPKHNSVTDIKWPYLMWEFFFPYTIYNKILGTGFIHEDLHKLCIYLFLIISVSGPQYGYWSKWRICLITMSERFCRQWSWILNTNKHLFTITLNVFIRFVFILKWIHLDCIWVILKVSF